jgi:hypothetical protein
MMFGRSFLYGPLRGPNDPPAGGGGTPPADESHEERADRLQNENEKLRNKATKKTLPTGAAEAWASYTNRLKAAQDPLTKIMDATIKIHEANEKLVKSGGDFYQKFAPGEEYHQAIQTLVRESQDFFGNATAGIEAFEGLASGMKSFMAVSSDTQANLGKTTMFMTQLGFKAEDLAKSMENQAMAFGDSEDKLKNHALTMAKVSNTLFIKPTELMRDFDKAQTEFAYNSDKTMEVFVAMEEQSRKTGVSFSSMAGAFGDQMDTFQGVSGIAGKLNAILGSSVFNPLELLNMDEAQRTAAVRKGIQDSPMLAGKDINQLSKFELKAVADGLNMSVLDTRKLLTKQGEVRSQMQKTVEDRVNASGGVKGEGMDIKNTNQELARMQDTLRNVRFASENLAIDMSKMAAGATDIALDKIVQKFGLAGPTMGRHFDIVRLSDAILAGTVKASDVMSKTLDEAMKLVLEAQNISASPHTRSPAGSRPSFRPFGLDDPDFRNPLTVGAGLGVTSLYAAGWGPDTPGGLAIAALGTSVVEKIATEVAAALGDVLPGSVVMLFKDAIASVFTEVATDKNYISHIAKAANDEKIREDM